MPFDSTVQGLYPIAATPFLPDGGLDEASLDRLIDFYLAAGATGVTVLGIMGEATKLEPDESLRIVDRFARRSGIPVLAGVSWPGFAGMRTLARSCMDAGAAGVMIAPPNTLRSDDQIVGYFAQAVEAIGDDVPWALQDYPLGLGVVMSASVIRRIVQNHPSCVMLKHEDWPGLEKLSAVRALQASGEIRPISIFIGNGGLFLDFEIERGADGAMTGYAFPEMLSEVVRLQKAGQRDEAHDLFDRHLPLLRYEQQPGMGLAVRKYVLQKRGAITHEVQRRPFTPLSAAARSEVEYLLGRLGAQHLPSEQRHS